MKLTIGSSLFVFIAAISAPVSAQMPHLDGNDLVVPLQDPANANRRSATVEDIVSLRDIKRISVSPDGEEVAFLVYKPIVDADSYKSAWFVAPTRPVGAALNVGDGGEPDFFNSQYRIDGSRGRNWSIEAKWSPDGGWIAYLRQSNDEVQIWRSKRNGRVQEQLTFNRADVRTFYWSADGERLIYSTGAPRAKLEAARLQDRRDGFLLKDHTSFLSWSYKHHQPFRRQDALLDSEATIWTIDLRSGNELPANAADKKYFRARESEIRDMGVAQSDEILREAPILRDIEPESINDLVFNVKRELHASVKGSSNATVKCPAIECAGLLYGPTKASAWLRSDGEAIYFWRRLRRHGPLTLFEWNIAQGTVEQIYKTRDTLTDCDVLNDRLICLRQTPTQPRTIVSIALGDGSITTLFDPNPEWAGVRLGEVRWLDWADQDGNTTSGVLVMPADFVEGQKYPLVISGYGTNNVVRGDAAARYPTHALSAEGFAVLVYSYQTGIVPLGDTLPKDRKEAVVQWWRGIYNSEMSAGKVSFDQVKSITEQLANEGLIDLDRIGIGGHSMGMNTAAYGLIHSNLFKAASLGWIRWNPTRYYGMGQDIELAAGLHQPANAPPNPVMSKLSMSFNAERIKAPVLVHASDYEFYSEAQAEAFVRFKDAGKPLEMYVFPDEKHTIFHPAHRYAENCRNVQWFKYWLQNEEVDDPVDPDQYARWRAMRNEQCARLKGAVDAPWYCRQ